MLVLFLPSTTANPSRVTGWKCCGLAWAGAVLQSRQVSVSEQNRARRPEEPAHWAKTWSFLMLCVVEIKCLTTGRRKWYLEVQGNRITSPPVKSHHSYGSARTARSLSTGPTAAPGRCWGRQSRAPLPSSCTQGLAKFNVRNFSQLSHGVIICWPVWRCSLMECTEGEPLIRWKFSCREAWLWARGLLPFSPVVAENSSRNNFC